MKNVSADQLKRFIEDQHGGTATFAKSMRLGQANANPADWDGIVHVYDLTDHPNAKRAYAWSASIKGSVKPRFFAVLHSGRVTGPLEAVKAAAAAIRKWGAQGTKS